MGFIGIHLGVGTYNEKRNFKEYENLLIKATKQAIETLQNGGSALEACAEAIKILEDDPLVNCGIGSNLTENGTVECDASLMDGVTQNFGACGAVSNVKNPIELAYKICINQSLDTVTVPPCLLVGEGAKSYAENAGLTMINSKSLISRRAYIIYKKYKKQVADYNDYVTQKKLELNDRQNCMGNRKRDYTVQYHRRNKYRKLDKIEIKSGSSNDIGNLPEVLQERMDTVGAVCIDNDGNLASGVSSGGIILKSLGRVGQACIMGAGIWADQNVSVTTTGCGEYIIKTHLAKEIADAASNNDFCVSEILKNKYVDAPILKNATSDKIVGAIVLRLNGLNSAEFTFAHTDKFMGVGYMNTKDTQPTTVISRTPDESHKIQVTF